MKFVFVLFFLCTVVYGNDDFKRLDSILEEGPCRDNGGMCTIAKDCPPGQLSEVRGLCPKQRSQRVECCYGLSVKETRCEKRGGMCMEGDKPCNKRLMYEEATDCPSDTKCCILVN